MSHFLLHYRTTRTLSETIIPVMFINEVKYSQYWICIDTFKEKYSIELLAMVFSYILFALFFSAECGDWWCVCGKSAQTTIDCHSCVQFPTHYCGTWRYYALCLHHPTCSRSKTEGMWQGLSIFYANI